MIPQKLQRVCLHDDGTVNINISIALISPTCWSQSHSHLFACFLPANNFSNSISISLAMINHTARLIRAVIVHHFIKLNNDEPWSLSVTDVSQQNIHIFTLLNHSFENSGKRRTIKAFSFAELPWRFIVIVGIAFFFSNSFLRNEFYPRINIFKGCSLASIGWVLYALSNLLSWQFYFLWEWHRCCVG